MYCGNQRGYVFRRGKLGYAVAKIEYMARSIPDFAERGEYPLGFTFDRLSRRKQHDGGQISLQCHAGSDALARGAQVHGPVNPDRVAAAGSDRLQPESAAFCEYDRWNALASLLTTPVRALKSGDDARKVGK